MEAYFDNSATTKVLDSVRDIVVKTMTEDYGNPAAKHRKGMEAEQYIRDARKIIADTMKVQEKEILYLESMRHEIWVHCEKKVFLTSETLGYWEEKLRVRSFLRVHKSFLVNPGQISWIGREMIELEDGSRLPVSRYRYPEVMARYEAWIRHAEFLE